MEQNHSLCSSIQQKIITVHTQVQGHVQVLSLSAVPHINFDTFQSMFVDVEVDLANFAVVECGHWHLGTPVSCKLDSC